MEFISCVLKISFKFFREIEENQLLYNRARKLEFFPPEGMTVFFENYKFTIIIPIQTLVSDLQRF